MKENFHINRARSREGSSGRVTHVISKLLLRKIRLKYMDRVETFQIANLGQVPSYISLTTALDYHGLTTQLQRDYFESIALKRTKEIKVE